MSSHAEEWGGPDDDFDPDDEMDEASDECGRGQNYEGCTLAGSEYCEFECPFRD
jgi:hypothetical protein